MDKGTGEKMNGNIEVDTVDDAGRYVDIFKGSKLYTIIGDEVGNGRPFSAMLSLTGEEANKDLHLLSDIDWLTLSTSMLLRKYPVEKVLNALRRYSRSPQTKQAITARNIERFIRGER